MKEPIEVFNDSKHPPKSSGPIKSSVFRLDLKLKTSLGMKMISVAAIVLDTQQQRQHNQQDNQLLQLTPSTSNYTEHSKIDSFAWQRETSTLTYNNDLETDTRKADPLADENNTTRLYTIATGDEETLTGSSADEKSSITDISGHHLTGDQMATVARKWLDNNARSEDGFRTLTTDLNLSTSKSSISSASVKMRRHTENYLSPGNWWTKISSKQTPGKTSIHIPTESKGSGSLIPNRYPMHVAMDVDKSTTATRKSPDVSEQSRSTKRVVPEPFISQAPKRFVYREQPLSQNAILTIRYQLGAIKRQHKTLVTRSMPQLQQLDNKLVESYKLCFKKKMPLYAGMLYRTRDFVVKMAKDVNHEKKLLEAMVNQVQKVLRQKTTNQTLVREYNQLVATSSEQGLSVPSPLTDLYESKGQPVFKVQSGPEGVSDTSSNRRVNPQNAVKVNLASRSSFTLPSSSLIGLTTSVKSIPESQERYSEITTMKPKPVKYVVSVNEVNLKKELNKVQNLIDRINGSSYELNSVVDDINHLFKLTTEQGNRKSPSISNTKMTKLNKFYSGQQDMRGKRLPIRSPMRVFFERYGKLTMTPQSETLGSSSNATVPSNTESIGMPIDPPEIKPLFESSSLTYTDPSDNDLGFSFAIASDGE